MNNITFEMPLRMIPEGQYSIPGDSMPMSAPDCNGSVPLKNAVNAQSFS